MRPSTAETPDKTSSSDEDRIKKLEEHARSMHLRLEHYERKFKTYDKLIKNLAGR